MKLWQKNTDANQAVDKFTVGRDREMDIYLAEADVLGSLAHTRSTRSGCSTIKIWKSYNVN